MSREKRERELQTRRHADRRRTRNRTPEERAARAAKAREETYGLTQAAYDAMREAQDGQCAICLQPHERLCVDHDHTSGDVRALLCNKCNTGLGMFEDDPDRIMQAATYLRLHRGGTTTS